MLRQKTIPKIIWRRIIRNHNKNNWYHSRKGYWPNILVATIYLIVQFKIVKLFERVHSNPCLLVKVITKVIIFLTAICFQLWHIIDGGSLAHPMLITAFSHFWPEVHPEPRNGVGSISLAECLPNLQDSAGNLPNLIRIP